MILILEKKKFTKNTKSSPKFENSESIILVNNMSIFLMGQTLPETQLLKKIKKKRLFF